VSAEYMTAGKASTVNRVTQLSGRNYSAYSSHMSIVTLLTCTSSADAEEVRTVALRRHLGVTVDHEVWMIHRLTQADQNVEDMGVVVEYGAGGQVGVELRLGLCVQRAVEILLPVR
jgi:hypothetical protein